jgi:hypothetical protein
MRTTYGRNGDSAPLIQSAPIVLQLTNEQKILACLERSEKLLQTLVDHMRPSGVKALYTGKPYAGKK